MLDQKINIITRNQSIELYIYKNRIEFEKFDFIFFQCWVLLIKYFNFNSLLLLHGVWKKIKRSTMKFILNFIFFYCGLIEIQISIKYGSKLLNLPK